MTFLGAIGYRTLSGWVNIRHIAATATAVALAVPDPTMWRRTVRDVFARQLYFTAVQAVPFVALIAATMGVAVVVQAQLWLNRAGQTALVGPVLVFIIVREVGPIVTNFIVIGRSGSAMTAELATMKIRGEVHVLDAQGLDPFVYLLLPRAAGMALSVLCLTIVFVVVTVFAGYGVGLLIGAGGMTPGGFLNGVLGAIRPADIFNLVAKTLLPGLLTGVICVTEGLSVGRAATDVPKAASRGPVRSVGALFLTSALVSVITYLT